MCLQLATLWIMGDRSVKKAPSQFARQINDYVRYVVGQQTDAKDGRWLEARTDRGKDYWRAILTKDEAINTNDIQILANLFGVNVYEFVRQARDHARGIETPRLNVRALDDAYEISDDPGDYGLAAKKRPKPTP